jgi:mycothiol synthase
VSETWEFVERLNATQRLDVLGLLNQLEVQIGREALDEPRRRVVVHGWRGEHWLNYHGDDLVGYALGSGSNPTVVELAGGGFEAELLAEIASDGRSVEWWIRDDCAIPNGSSVVRTLHLLEIDLPTLVAPIPADVTMRAFEPGHDNAAWIEQNNLAFADHPEQGAWRSEDLMMRIEEPWFDPSGFLLFEMDGIIAASCWTKVHELHPDRFGEIYVISVRPSHQGHHLGRVAVTQGLNVLKKKGVSRAILFVDDSNIAALALYERLGFRTVRRDHLLHFA